MDAFEGRAIEEGRFMSNLAAYLLELYARENGHQGQSPSEGCSGLGRIIHMNSDVLLTWPGSNRSLVNRSARLPLFHQPSGLYIACLGPLDQPAVDASGGFLISRFVVSVNDDC